MLDSLRSGIRIAITIPVAVAVAAHWRLVSTGLRPQEDRQRLLGLPLLLLGEPATRTVLALGRCVRLVDQPLALLLHHPTPPLREPRLDHRNLLRRRRAQPQRAADDGRAAHRRTRF